MWCALLEVTLVVADLAARVEDVALPPADERRDAVLDVRDADGVPLLELDDDRACGVGVVVPGDQAIEPSGR